MSLAAVQAGLSQNVQISSTTVNCANGATGTLTNNSITGTSITIQNPTTVTTGTSITIPVPQFGGAGTNFNGQGSAGGVGSGLLNIPNNGAGGGYFGGVQSIQWPPQRNLTEDDLKAFVEFFGSIFSGYVLVDNETTQKKEVFPMFEGFQVFQLAKNMGQIVNVTMLDKKQQKCCMEKNNGSNKLNQLSRH